MSREERGARSLRESMRRLARKIDPRAWARRARQDELAAQAARAILSAVSISDPLRAARLIEHARQSFGEDAFDRALAAPAWIRPRDLAEQGSWMAFKAGLVEMVSPGEALATLSCAAEAAELMRKVPARSGRGATASEVAIDWVDRRIEEALAQAGVRVKAWGIAERWCANLSVSESEWCARAERMLEKAPTPTPDEQFALRAMIHASRAKLGALDRWIETRELERAISAPSSRVEMERKDTMESRAKARL